jgi:deazaflavin-dependent oxidoreductase (nitroreductase family)
MIVSDGFWKRIRTVQRIHQRLYAAGLGWVVGWIILLLEHTGRKSGNHYVTPLQYEEMDGLIYVGAGRGPKADWYRNILANPDVHVRVGRRSFDGRAEPVTDLPRKLAFLKYRFKRHPFMLGLMMKFHRLPMRPDEAQMQELAETLAIVILHNVKTLER